MEPYRVLDFRKPSIVFFKNVIKAKYLNIKDVEAENCAKKKGQSDWYENERKNGLIEDGIRN